MRTHGKACASAGYELAPEYLDVRDRVVRADEPVTSVKALLDHCSSQIDSFDRDEPSKSRFVSSPSDGSVSHAVVRHTSLDAVCIDESLPANQRSHSIFSGA